MANKVAELSIVIRARNAAKKAFASIGKNLSRLKTAVFNVRNALVALGLAFSVNTFVNAGIAFEQIDNTLKAVAGSSAAATKEFEFISAEANRLGLNLLSTAQEYAKLTAASKGTALQGQATRDIFTAVSEAGVVLGLSAATQAGALTAIQQIMSKGTVSAEELRGQLGERLPGAFQIAARAMGVTTQELGKMLEQGQLTSDVFLPKFAAELKKTFGKDLKDATDSTRSNLNRVGTAFFKFKKEIGDLINKNEAVKKSIKSVATFFEILSNRIGENGGSISEFISGFVKKATTGLEKLFIGSAKLVDFLKPVFDFIASGFTNFINFFNGLPTIIKELGIVGVLIGGAKIKAILIVISLVIAKFEDLGRLFDWVKGQIVKAKDALFEFLGVDVKDSILNKTLGFLGFSDARTIVEKTKKSLELLGGDIADFVGGVKDKAVDVIGDFSIAKLVFGENTGQTEKFVKEIISNLKDVKEASNNTFKNTQGAAEEAFKAVSGSSKTASEKMSASMRSGVNIIKRDLESVGETAKNTFSGISKNAKTTAESVNRSFRGLNPQQSEGIFTRLLTGELGTVRVSGTTGIFNNGFPKIPSFATGIRFVPRDMTADIHRGERVLTAQENREIGNGKLGSRTISFGDINVNVASSTEAPEKTARRIHAELKRIDERRSN